LQIERKITLDEKHKGSRRKYKRKIESKKEEKGKRNEREKN
jgi:hypothetical protein